MSTNNFTGSTASINSPITPKPIPTAPTMPSTPSQSAIPTLVREMQSVKTDTPEAKLNETTISDGKGGRITLDDQTKHQKSNTASTIMGNLADQKW
jgi:hypothetical protein